MYVCRIILVVLVLSSGLTALVLAMTRGEHVTTADDGAAALKPVGEFAHPVSHTVGGLSFTPDGTHLVGLGYDQDTRQGLIHFWDMKDRKLVRTLREPDTVADAVFTPDGKRLVTSCWDNKLRIYSTADRWELKHTFDYDPPGHTASHLSLFPDGKRLLSGGPGYQGPRIWDLETRTATPLPSPHEQVGRVAVSRDGKRFVVMYAGPMTEIWDTEKLEVIGRLEMEAEDGGKGRKGGFTSIALGPDGTTIATGCLTKEGPVGKPALRIWDAKTFKLLHESDKLEEPPIRIAYTPDSKLIVTSVGARKDQIEPGIVYVWEAATGKLVHRFQSAKDGGMVSALSPDGRWLVTCSSDGHLRLWDFAQIRKAIGK